MKRLTVRFAARRFTSTCLLLLLMLVFTACSTRSDSTTPSSIAGTARSGSNSTRKDSINGSTPTATLPAGVKLGPQPCPDAVKTSSHWDPIIPTQSGFTQVGSVACGNLLDNTSLQALVNVYNEGTGQFLDAYVYTDITNVKPARLFALKHLDKGSAQISGNNTVITNEVDANSSVNKGQPNAVLKSDLDREFTWSAQANAFIQIAFPGMFPDLTRYHAEANQTQVNQGHQRWKLDAAMTAQAFAENFLQWFPNPTATVQTGGNSHDIYAVVLVNNPDSDGGAVQVTLARLEGNTSGIWEVVDVESAGISLTAPQNRALLTSPVSLTGSDTASEDVFDTVAVFDHLYSDIGHTYANFKHGNYSSIYYTSSFQEGVQEGIVAVYAYKRYDGTITKAVMKKVLLGAKSG